MSIVIANGIGDTANIGVHAVLISTIALVRSIDKDVPIYVIPWQRKSERVLTIFNTLTAPFNHVCLVDPILPANSDLPPYPSSTLLTKVRILAWTAAVHIKAEAEARRRRVSPLSPYDAIYNARLLILPGCNIVQNQNGLRGLRAFASVRRALFPVQVAQRAGIPTMLLNVSIGHLKNVLTRRLVSHVAEKANLVSIREKSSHLYLKQIAECDPILGADTVFALPPVSKTDGLPDSLLVGLNVLSLGEFASALQKSPAQYAWTLQRLAEELDLLLTSNPDVRIVGIPHEIDHVELNSDLLTLRQLMSMMSHSDRVWVREDVRSPQGAIDAYACCTVALGMRFHGCVLSSLASTPVVGIDLQSRKVQGIAEELGLREWMIDLGCRGQLSARVGKALQCHSELRNQVAERTRHFSQRVHEVFSTYYARVIFNDKHAVNPRAGSH